ncbi:hypothetical protein JIQ42_00496 [Leishmania sp. Namibia]|uniref:hypothetical protein n=1 Tax=Leishmania sp. Namibia TaxID=2802991 RepID=UPI001B456E01|nr:hypothetical protein JIQ42_00496 [Leishmania sp. Namibia]
METHCSVKGKSDSSETENIANDSFSMVNHPTTSQPDSQCKTGSDTIASAASPLRDRVVHGSVAQGNIYTDLDQSCICNDATLVLWETDAGGSAASLHTAEEASSTKGGAESIMPAPKRVVPASPLVRYVQSNNFGDAAPVIVSGCKYVFDNRTLRWLTHPITVRVLHHNRGVHQDKYFATFAIELLDPVKPATPMFARVYRHNIDLVSEADYYSLGQTQALCEEFARDYARTEGRSHYLKFHLPLLTNRVVVRLDMLSVCDPLILNARKGFFSYRTRDTRQLLFLMEPNTKACQALGVSFASPEVDEGRCYARGYATWSRDIFHDIADGFSHFTYFKSRMCMVVHGLVRSDGYLLDPLFHTTDREGLRLGDGGRSAIVGWAERHRCGDTCRALGISNFGDDGQHIEKAAVFANPLDREENYYTDYLRSVLQMRVVARVNSAVLSDDEGRYGIFDTTLESIDPGSAVDTAQTVPVSPFPIKVTCDAIKYVFLPTCAKWMEAPMRLTVSTPSVPHTVDDEHAYFAIEEECEGGQPMPMRARFILRPDTRDADYYHIGDAYCVCMALGHVFRKYRANGVPARELDFYAAYAVRVPQANIPQCMKVFTQDNNFFAHTTADSGDVMFVVELEFQPLDLQCAIPAGGAKTDNEGFDDVEFRQVVDAFSHFTLHKSGNQLLVCHLRCKDGLLMHPNINTSSGCGFGTLNRGQVGIDAWAKAHICNAYCRLIGMEPLSRPLKLYDISSSHLMRYVNLVQEHAMGTGKVLELVSPTRRALDAMPSAVPVADAGQFETMPESPATTDVATLALTVLSGTNKPCLRPWMGGEWKAGAAGLKRGTAQRRTPTQQELMRLQSKGIDTTYIFPATRYDLNMGDLTWTCKRIFVRIVNPKRGIGQGGMRVCFDITVVDPVACEETPMVAKMFRRTIKNVIEKDYFTSVMVQQLSSLFAKDFNGERKEGCPLPLHVLEGAVIALNRVDLPPDLLAKRTGFFSYRTQDTERVLFCVEAKLVGRFTKYNSNMGEAYPTNECRLSPTSARERTAIFEAVEALSHYSLEKSEGGLLVCDMQGVKNDLTDLEVHTYDGQGLGVGNFGLRGIQKFAMRHRCSSVCKSLNLEKLHDRHFVVTDDLKTRNRFLAILERIKEIGGME